MGLEDSEALLKYQNVLQARPSPRGLEPQLAKTLAELCVLNVVGKSTGARRTIKANSSRPEAWEAKEETKELLLQKKEIIKAT